MGKGQSLSFCSRREGQICGRGGEQEQPGLKEAGTEPVPDGWWWLWVESVWKGCPQRVVTCCLYDMYYHDLGSHINLIT